MGVICNLLKVKKEKREKRETHLGCLLPAVEEDMVEDSLCLSLKFSYNKLWSVVVIGLWGYKIMQEVCDEKLTSTV